MQLKNSSGVEDVQGKGTESEAVAACTCVKDAAGMMEAGEACIISYISVETAS